MAVHGFSSILKMDLFVYFQLILLCVLNTIFTFSGIILNTLVIASIWKSSQLRKKLCHFMIMVLSCFDLVTVTTNHPVLLYLISWLMEDYDLLLTMGMYLEYASVFPAFSVFALLVMNIERYLGAYYPIFHRTSVTRRRLLTFLAILLIITTAMYIISGKGMKVIRGSVFLAILMALFVPLFTFVNFKLFIIVRKVRRERAISPGKRTTMNLKNISMGLWAVACLMLLCLPGFFFIVFDLTENSINTLRLSMVWAVTCNLMNCTFNSLIFFWKNKVLRTEGIKILKTLKYRKDGS